MPKRDEHRIAYRIENHQNGDGMGEYIHRIEVVCTETKWFGMIA